MLMSSSGNQLYGRNCLAQRLEVDFHLGNCLPNFLEIFLRFP